MKNKTLWKQVHGSVAATLAAEHGTGDRCTVRQAVKQLAVSSQKQLNQSALKYRKGEECVFYYRKSREEYVKITIPKGTYKSDTFRVVGKKAAVVNNGTVKEDCCKQ